jgi:hypothetical protein
MARRFSPTDLAAAVELDVNVEALLFVDQFVELVAIVPDSPRGSNGSRLSAQRDAR